MHTRFVSRVDDVSFSKSEFRYETEYKMPIHIYKYKYRIHQLAVITKIPFNLKYQINHNITD